MREKRKNLLERIESAGLTEIEAIIKEENPGKKELEKIFEELIEKEKILHARKIAEYLSPKHVYEANREIEERILKRMGDTGHHVVLIDSKIIIPHNWGNPPEERIRGLYPPIRGIYESDREKEKE